MGGVHWTKVVLVVLILSLLISVVAITVSTFVHRTAAIDSWESLTFVSQR
jgi:hypothetical protein